MTSATQSEAAAWTSTCGTPGIINAAIVILDFSSMVYDAEVRLGSKKETNKNWSIYASEIFQYAKKTRSLILALISVFR